MNEINVGRELSAMRKKTIKKCLICGIEFKAIKTAKFCSSRCRSTNRRRKDKKKVQK